MSTDVNSGITIDEKLVQFKREDFDAAVGQTFSIKLSDEKILPLNLTDIKNSTFDNPGFDSFSLYFLPPPGEPALPDNSYILENASLGKLFIHLSATPGNSGKPQDYEYEAVFNLRRE